MNKFSADQFFSVVSMIGSLKMTLLKAVATEEQGELAQNTRLALELMGIKCGEIGLMQTFKAILHARDSLAEPLSLTEIECTLGHLDQISRSIKWEMEDHLFMHIPIEQAKFYNRPELFGKEVNGKFPMIQYDLVEAGNCYAAGRSTAVVFHLMRIMEVGVQQFGAKLGVALANQKNWQNILDEINKAVKGLLAKDPITVEMSQASANLYAVKLAWRNEVMHPNDTYTLEEAKNLIEQVRIFMQQLANII